MNNKLLSIKDNAAIKEITAGLVAKGGWILFIHTWGGARITGSIDVEPTGETYSQENLAELAKYTPLRKWIIVTDIPFPNTKKLIEEVGSEVDNLVYIHRGDMSDYYDFDQQPRGVIEQFKSYSFQIDSREFRHSQKGDVIGKTMSLEDLIETLNL